MKLGIVGSRTRSSNEDKEIIRSAVMRMKPSELVSGGCTKGADRFAEEIALEFGIPLSVIYPQFIEKSPYWIRVKAYHARNEEIAQRSDMLIALPSADRTGGTENAISHMRNLGKAVIEL